MTDFPQEQQEGLAVDTPQTREAAAAGRPTAVTVEEADAVGYFGSPSDPEPNETYTIAGQVAAMPAPDAIRNAPEGEEPQVVAPMQTVTEAAAGEGMAPVEPPAQ